MSKFVVHCAFLIVLDFLLFAPARAEDADVAAMLGLSGGCVSQIKDAVCDFYGGASGTGEKCSVEYSVLRDGRVTTLRAFVDEGRDAPPSQVLREGSKNVAAAVGAIIVNEVADKVKQTAALIAWPYNAIRARQRIGLIGEELQSRICRAG